MGQLSKISAALRRVRDPAIRERLLMVQAAYELPLRDAAEKFGCTHGKIDYWKQRYAVQGLRGLQTKPRAGRPPKLSTAQSRKIRRMVRKHNMRQGWRTVHVRQLITEEAGVKYSCHTIRIIQSWGLSKIRPHPALLQAQSAENSCVLHPSSHLNPTLTCCCPPAARAQVSC